MTNWMIFTPELHCLLMGAVFLGLSLAPEPNPRRDHLLGLVLSAVGVGVCLASLRLSGDLFMETYRVDLFSQVFKTMLAMGLFLSICLCTGLSGIEKRLHPEFYLLLSVCTLAMMMLVSAVHLLTVYVALELSSYALYTLVFLRKGRHQGVNAGITYFLTGASASAVLLFGLALLYGATGSAYVIDLIRASSTLIDRPTVAIGLTLALGGFFFKLAVFPFHFWAPDVYQGAANQVTAYIATASKVAAIAIVMRIAALSGGGSEYLVEVLIALAVVSMTVGNLAAVVQKDFKRLMAYSSIAHGGYVLIGILSMNPAGYAAAIFYALTVLVLKFTCFLVMATVAADGRNMAIDELAGLHRRSPVLALALMMAVFGLAGIPPTIGFSGKLLLFTAAMEKGYLALIIIAMINVVISLYYYLLVVRAAYLAEPVETMPAMRIAPGLKVLTVMLIAVIVMVGIYPQPLIELARQAARGLVG